MKVLNSKIIICIYSICSLIASLIVTLLNIFVPFDFLIHPALNYFFLVFICFGLLLLFLGIKKGSNWYFFLGSVLFGLDLIYVLIALNFIWWLSIIIVGTILLIFSIVAFSVSLLKTNEKKIDTSYETYSENKQIKTEEIKKPEIKSFK